MLQIASLGPYLALFVLWLAMAAASLRHMVAAPDGEVWLACSGVDRMARVRVVSREGGYANRWSAR